MDTDISHATLFVGARAQDRREAITTLVDTLQGGDASPDVSWHTGLMSVEEARDVVHRAAYSPYASPHAIYVIEEADRLSQEAANTLLKRMEEPPARTVFILSSGTEGGVYPTIRSRTRVVRVFGNAVAPDEHNDGRFAQFVHGPIAARLAIAEDLRQAPREETAGILEAWSRLHARDNAQEARILYRVSRALRSNANMQAALTYAALSFNLPSSP